ncbi:MAG TPA: MFS transporter [Spirochaetota bacterium]|nr:MFS transporter [Spirochaetota bacterium]OPZ35947.1 MAG: Inner membrane symporter YicJ [Spirochaetes bacterium ADurb.BinA120]HNU91785.1 MFS transporter [Spirochaetota bacterium]HPI14045.1 MFS transporter [Spirochaetota bacterium]HPV98799.1 MFS transporter [Spirochaetota bacterium]
MKPTPSFGSVKKVATSIKLAYGFGDIGSNIFIISSGFFLLFFLTNVVGVNPALAGVALLFPKLWDVVSDPIMGAISDRTVSRWGRRRPYLLFGALPFGLSFFAMFLAPGFESESARALQVALLFALACTAFTVVNVPYSSMVAEMSDDYNERMSITSFRMIGSSIGVLLAGGMAMPLVEMGGGGADGFRFMGIVFGAAIALITLVCFLGTGRARTLPAAGQMPPAGEQLRIALKNRPFLLLASSYMLQSAGMGVLMAGLIYYIKHVMMLPESAMGVVFPILFGTAIVFIPIWVKVGKKLGKIRAYRTGLAIIIILLVSTFFTRSEQLILFYVQVFLLGIGFSSFQLFPFSMLPDTIEYDEMRSGLRREGIFSGVWASGQKMAYSVGPGIMGFALALSGFDASGPQGPGVETGIRVAFCLLPAAALLLSYIPFARYDLTEERFEEIKRTIASGSAH